MEIRIILFALHPFAVFRVGAASGLTAWLLLDGAHSDGFLSLLYRSAEVALGLRSLGVAAGFGGMHRQQACEVVVV